MIIKTKTGIHHSIQSAIEAEWKEESGRMDWLGMEQLIRLTLRAFRVNELKPNEIINKIDEIVAVFTKRGNELP